MAAKMRIAVLTAVTQCRLQKSSHTKVNADISVKTFVLFLESVRNMRCLFPACEDCFSLEQLNGEIEENGINHGHHNPHQNDGTLIN